MQINDMEVTSFSPGDTPRSQRTNARYTRAQNGRRRKRTNAGGMLVKIGFCVFVLAAAVLVQKFVLEADGRAVVEASAEETPQEENAPEDVLGRLRFVEAGGAKSVFATSQRWSMPVSGGKATLTNDELLLSIASEAGKTVSVAAAGEVRAIAYDEALGEYIRLHHGSDLESVYYNISDIRVEVGQPLKAGDTLGKVGDTGKLYVSVSQSGAPQLPAAYLDVPE